METKNFFLREGGGGGGGAVQKRNRHFISLDLLINFLGWVIVVVSI